MDRNAQLDAYWAILQHANSAKRLETALADYWPAECEHFGQEAQRLYDLADRMLTASGAELQATLFDQVTQ